MRVVQTLFVILSGLCATAAPAQEWRDYVNTQDRFRVRVPGEFAVT